jgi:protein-arginine kinase activator protein McsA
MFHDMINQPKCIDCDKPARLHFTQIIGTKVHKLDFCMACARKNGIKIPKAQKETPPQPKQMKIPPSSKQRQSLKCVVCGKPSLIHLTEIINNKVNLLDFCEACARKKGIGPSNPQNLMPEPTRSLITKFGTTQINQ